MIRLTKLSFLIALFTTHLCLAQTPTLKGSIDSYSTLVHETYAEALKRAELLRDAIRLFTDTPSVVTLEQAKVAWTHAREAYGPTEVYRFYNGPIDRDQGPEGQLNSWPLDEAYIDYTLGAPAAGIINNQAEFPSLTKDLLISLNELDGEKNVSTGYHAIEFLLWGQDFFTDSPGQRSYEDYTTAPNAQRRAQYLNLLAEILVDDLSSLEVEWRSNAVNFRVEFEKLKEQDALRKILSGIIFMAGDELSGERMYVAYDSQGQEDEHSCFSDTTHLDLRWNFLGVVNVIRALDLLNLPEVKGSKVSQEIEQRLLKIDVLLKSIPAPFDQAIADPAGRQIILSSVEELEALAKDLVEISGLLNARVDY